MHRIAAAFACVCLLAGALEYAPERESLSSELR